ncbi:MAG: hypothetical protein HY716_14515 [Planctomycetes bacterium]|nr:hypothetical protein [Planctomycetota bacterium]
MKVSHEIFVALSVLLLAQDEPAPPEQPSAAAVKRFATLLEHETGIKLELAAKGLLSCGRAGYEALQTAVKKNPDLLKTIGEPPGYPKTDGDKEIMKNLESKRVSLNFKDTQLQTATALLKQFLEVAIEAGTELPDTSLSVKVDNVSAKTLLDKCIHPTGQGWTVENGKVLIVGKRIPPTRSSRKRSSLTP